VKKKKFPYQNKTEEENTSLEKQKGIRKNKNNK